ncbi:DNA repair protein RadA [Clostridia bacterium]|nr:DNA repair protein RadA [Clostridia bacterium]
MAKSRSVFVCSECGQESPKWMGKCPGCGAWNTLNEEKPINTTKSIRSLKEGKVQSLARVSGENRERMQSGLVELDRVLGGGFVLDSLVLLGGDPGIGKSTLLLQSAEKLAAKEPLLYVSGEESASQIKMRAERLGIRGENILILPENNLERILNRITKENPKVIIMDSIQTVYTEESESAPGSVSQVRECAMKLMLEAKGSDRIIILVGHVTKSGNLAGPRVLEHMVDTVLYLEGDKNQEFRILRGAKNRFGSTHEIGIFEMKEKGLIGVENPGELFLSRKHTSSGIVVYPSLEGSRVFLLEIQALCAKSPFGNPRRLSSGYDLNRLHLMLAILEKKMHYVLADQDIYINVAGGMKVQETAADLAVCMAIVSSLKEKRFDATTLALGEVGLGGEIRNVPQIEKRVLEAHNLGYRRVLLPWEMAEKLAKTAPVELIGVKNIREAIERTS